MQFDWSIIARYGVSFVDGAVMTLVVSVAATLIGVVIGMLTALARLSPWAPLRGAARVYVEVIRGTPLLVQLFFLYAALPLYGIRLSAVASGIVALSLYTGAFAAEIFRAGITSVHRGHVEAARSLGMSYAQATRRIVAPLMAVQVLPPLTSEFTGVIKWSSLLSVVTVPELTYAAYRAIGETYSAVEPLLVAGLLYWGLNDLVVAVGRGLERRLTRHLTCASPSPFSGSSASTRLSDRPRSSGGSTSPLTAVRCCASSDPAARERAPCSAASTSSKSRPPAWCTSTASRSATGWTWRAGGCASRSGKLTASESGSGSCSRPTNSGLPGPRSATCSEPSSA